MRIKLMILIWSPRTIFLNYVLNAERLFILKKMLKESYSDWNLQ